MYALHNILRKRCLYVLLQSPGYTVRWTRLYRLVLPEYGRRTGNNDFSIWLKKQLTGVRKMSWAVYANAVTGLRLPYPRLCKSIIIGDVRRKGRHVLTRENNINNLCFSNGQRNVRISFFIHFYDYERNVDFEKRVMFTRQNYFWHLAC